MHAISFARQLPCGRLVILCESCALEFYDVLIKKIAKFEATFEEFLLEQQEKKQVCISCLME